MISVNARTALVTGFQLSLGRNDSHGSGSMTRSAVSQGNDMSIAAGPTFAGHALGGSRSRFEFKASNPEPRRFRASW